MSVQVGVMTVPIFARINDEDLRLGELEVAVSAVQVENEDGSLSFEIDGHAMEQEITRAFETVQPTRTVRDDNPDDPALPLPGLWPGDQV